MKTQIQRFVQVALFIFIMLSLGLVAVHAQDDNRPRLRVVNASLGVPKADVYLNDTLYFSNVFYSYISNYIPVDATTLRLRVLPAGVKDVGQIVERDWAFEAERDYTMVIVGTSENIDEIWVFDDDNQTPLEPGQARVRFLHASRDAPAVEICLDNQCNRLAYRENEDNYVTIDAGTYDLGIRLIGTDEVHFDVLPIGFKAGEVYSIFILDPQQGEVRPRIIPHIDTGRLLPQPPGDAGKKPPYGPDYPGEPLPYAPGEPGQPPAYPPVTGSFLSPSALGILFTVIVLGLIGGFWIVRRQFSKT